MAKSFQTKVLVIDDDPSIGEEICDALHLRDLPSLFTDDISKAREILSSDEDLGVVVVDYHMPRMNGVEVIDVLSKEFQRPLVFLMLTGDETQQVAIDAIRAKTYDFLNKPVDGRKLSEAVHRAMSHLASIKAALDTESFLVSETASLKTRVDDLSNKLKHREDLLRHALLSEQVAVSVVGDEIRDSLRQLLAHSVELRSQLSRVDSADQLPIVEAMMMAELKLAEIVESIIPADTDSAQTPLARSPVDLGSLMKRIGPAIQQMVSDRTIKFRWRIPATLPLLYADERKLSRAITDMSAGMANALTSGEELSLMAIVAERELIITFRIVGADIDETPLRVLSDELSHIFANLNDLDPRWAKLAAARVTIQFHGGRIKLEEGPHGERFLRVILPIPKDMQKTIPNLNKLSA